MSEGGEAEGRRRTQLLDKRWNWSSSRLMRIRREMAKNANAVEELMNGTQFSNMSISG